jgi:hypothetical protein
MTCRCHKKMHKNGSKKGKQQWRCVHCGHTFLEDSRTPLTPKEIVSIFKHAKNGTTVAATAEGLGISRAGVYGASSTTEGYRNLFRKGLKSNYHLKKTSSPRYSAKYVVRCRLHRTR